MSILISDLFAEEFFLSDPILQNKIPAKYKSHKEIYENAILKGCRVVRKIQELQELGKDSMELFS